MPNSSTTAHLQQEHAPSAIQYQQRLHTVCPQFHHPIVHAAQHIASPLSGALLIFWIHKSWQVSAAMATIRSTSILLRAGKWSVKPHLLGTAVCLSSIGIGLYARTHAPPPLDVDDCRREKLLKIYQLNDVPVVDHALAKWWTSAYVNRSLQMIHDQGIPWWGAILTVTILFRFALVPVNALLLRNSLRMKLILPEIERHHTTMRTATNAETKIKAAEALRTLLQTCKCSPWKQTVVFPLIMPTAVLAIFTAVHNLCMAEDGMTTEGTLWFEDLIQRDETFLLPILSALTWLWMVELGASSHYSTMPNLRTGVRLLSVATIPLASTLPCGVFVFWVTSNMFAITRAKILSNNWVRRKFNCPLQSEIDAIAKQRRRGGGQ
jgi:membrane protein insertase Oxa1/YidC/SpoIIIJ